MGKRKRALAAGVLAFAVLLLIASWFSRRERSPEGARGEAALQPALALRTSALVAEPVPPAPPSPARAVALPVVDEVRVEKDEVCEGEENLVTIRAHTTDGNDDELHYTVAGEPGSQVPVRAYVGRDGTAPPQFAVAFSRANVAVRVGLPRWRVKNCRPERILMISARVLPNSIAEREFTAIVQSLDGSGFVPVGFEWSFGDGTPIQAGGGVAVHDYARLPQRTAFTDVLVTAKAYDAAGRTVAGRLALQLRNVAFFGRRAGLVTIFAEPSPRFPVMGRDGVVRQGFRVWHAEDTSVQIVGATRAKMMWPPSAGAPPPAPQPVAADPAVLFRHASIAPGTVNDESIEFDFGSDPAAYAIVYEIQGMTPDGMPARGQLTLMRPQPRPTRENSVPIGDPAMVQKIRRAMAILKQETVSQEDLWRLEREGKLE